MKKKKKARRRQRYTKKEARLLAMLIAFASLPFRPNYQEIGRKILKVDPLPQGALAYYVREKHGTGT